jgi:4-methyl-5(b-hydroxyethyl)-thiazole monophosphate biosynthesis
VTDTVAFDDEKHLITSRGPATVLPFAFAIVDALGGDSAFIKQRFLYNALKEYPDGI